MTGPGRLRIIAGQFKGRRIRVPHGERVRPTADRVREALFSILGERVRGARVADLFAGSGALGLEALSRGAATVEFVELDPGAVAVLRENVASLGPVERCRIVPGDVLRLLERRSLSHSSFDLVLADPPYGAGMAERLLGLIGEGWLGATGRLVLERAADDKALGADPEGLQFLRSARYGDTRLEFYGPAGPT